MTPVSTLVASTVDLLLALLHSANRRSDPPSMRVQLEPTHWCPHFGLLSDVPLLCSSMIVQTVPHTLGRSPYMEFCRRRRSTIQVEQGPSVEPGVSIEWYQASFSQLRSVAQEFS